jgi:hypothetical protein
VLTKAFGSLLLFVGAAMLWTAAGAQQHRYIGVVEERPILTSQDIGKQVMQLRLAFEYEGGKWIAACVREDSGCEPFDGSKRLAWDVRYAGHLLGPIETQGWDGGWLSQIGALRIVSRNVPQVDAADAGRFTRWGDAVGEKRRRPLIATLGFKNGDFAPASSRRDATVDDLREILPIVVKSVPHVPSCRRDQDDEIRDAEGPPTEPDDVAIFDSILVRGSGRLFGVDIRVARSCPLKDWPKTTVWIFRGSTGSTQVFKDFEMWIEIADFLGDGRVEAVVPIGGYNEDGYALLYDDFSKRVEFKWSYH